MTRLPLTENDDETVEEIAGYLRLHGYATERIMCWRCGSRSVRWSG